MIQDADKFLDLLSDGEPCTFQTFDETTAKRKTLNKILHGELCDQAEKLETLNQRGAGVFVMVNSGDLKGRTAKNVQRVRAAFVDLDGAPIEPVLEAPLQPHIVVESSPGRFHAYWLTDGISNQEFRAVQEMLARRFDGDPVVKDLARVMRLPGFLHQKEEPYLTHILRTNEQDRFERADFFDAFGFDPTITDWKDNQPIHEGQRNNKLFSMARGFATKGFVYQSIFERLCRINEQRCKPLLDATEIDQIVRQALQYGAGGALTIDYSLIDSPKYVALSPMARLLDMAVRRMTNGSTQSVISLLPRDLDQWGFGNRKTLSKYRDELMEQGFLIQHRPPQYGRNGETRECGLYRLNDPDFYGKNYPKTT